ncbi:hypothetical protein NC653_026718 [Populus alba x Populus x berolinensis]|uniref:Uncharacterized protein n=1 Tax=Populus alba x Populus x berolinensis TaxID=444605 RepID=A0AAD6M3Q0_9ROSI|nr:hypothetical protein NC653_026718 [Populus alba x Populus x berolinensis]
MVLQVHRDGDGDDDGNKNAALGDEFVTQRSNLEYRFTDASAFSAGTDSENSEDQSSRFLNSSECSKGIKESNSLDVPSIKLNEQTLQYFGEQTGGGKGYAQELQQEKSRKEIENELEGLFKQKIEAEIEHLALMRLQKLGVAADCIQITLI